MSGLYPSATRQDPRHSPTATQTSRFALLLQLSPVRLCSRNSLAGRCSALPAEPSRLRAQNRLAHPPLQPPANLVKPLEQTLRLRYSEAGGTLAVHAQRRGRTTWAFPQQLGRQHVRSYAGESDWTRKKGVSTVSWHVWGRCFFLYGASATGWDNARRIRDSPRGPLDAATGAPTGTTGAREKTQLFLNR